jgi:hypothetical protein
MTRRRELTAALFAAAALGVAAGCGGGGDTAGTDGGSSGSATDVSGNDGTAAPGGGPLQGIDLALSIDEVKTLTLEGDLNVRGFVVSADGQTLLCTTAEGNPPACGKPSLVLVGYEGEVPSPEETFVTGEVAGNKLVVRD